VGLFVVGICPERRGIERNFLEHILFGETVRVPLTREQAEEHERPRMPGTEQDTRARGFAEKYGELFQIELGALPPEVLRDLFPGALDEYWDEEAYMAVMEQEAVERKRPLCSGGASIGSADSLAPPLPLLAQQYSRTLQPWIRER
jgi:hypothetical protein